MPLTLSSSYNTPDVTGKDGKLLAGYTYSAAGEKLSVLTATGSGEKVVTDPDQNGYIYNTDADVYNTVISAQSYTGYDSHGRITAMTDAQGRRITAQWMDRYDLLTAMSLPDAGLTTTYTHTPLVGCTSITSPSGKKRSFSYTAGRLTGERNTASEQVASYSYQLYGDGSSTDAANRISATVHDTSGSATDVTYYDGFGMPVQTIATVAGGSLVRTAIEYDGLDRPVKQYLPVPASDASYASNVLFLATNHYGDNRPFAETRYRNMAGDKPLEVIREGVLMQSHPERYEYLCNNTTDAMLKCRRYRLSGSADSESVTLDGLYPAGALDVTRVIDPDSCTMLTFTDWRGLTMLERRVVSDSEFADTYYLYDVLGNVRVILQPEGSAQMTANGNTWTQSDAVMDRFAFINRYDRRGNLVYAKVPGAGGVEMRYDAYNRLAYRQTASMAEQGKAEFMLYDPIGRSALTGITTSALPAEGSIPAMTATWSANAFNDGIGGSGYTSAAGTDSNISMITSVSYYDNYGFLTQGAFSSLPADSLDLDSTRCRGMLTGTRTGSYELGNSGDCQGGGAICSVYSYDAEERAVGTVSNTASDRMKMSVRTSYSRQGQPLGVATTVTTPDSVYTLNEQLTHYASGEPWTHRARLTVSDGAGMSATTPASGHEYMYNNLGQLAGYNAGNGYFNTAYTYDMRGRLKRFYTMPLSQMLEYEGSDVPCYNGNISGMTLSLRNNADVSRRYSYDSLNRLTAVSRGDSIEAAYSYSLNSSPLIILRGNSMVTLSYDGNRPVGVGSRKLGYDVDGRLTSDATRGISDILYSPNDRPVCVSTDEGTRLEYRYDATGRKLTEQTVKWEPLMRSWQIVKSAMRVYVGPFEFSTLGDGISLERVNLPWGYLDANRREMRYIKDYQGNVLAVTDASGMLHQATDYTPYGQPSALSTLAANYGIDIPAADNRRLYGGKEYETLRGLNFHDFEARMLLNDRGLFNRPDPKAIEYPGFNPYLYCAGNPLRYVDPTGKKIVFDSNSSEQFKNTFKQAYALMKEKQIDFVVTELMNRDETIILQESTNRTSVKSANNFNVGKRTIEWNPSESILTDKMVVLSPVELLSHECDHALQSLKKPEQQKVDGDTVDEQYSNKEEKRVITGSESIISRKLGNIKNNETTRNNHNASSIAHIDKLLPTLDEFFDSIAVEVNP